MGCLVVGMVAVGGIDHAHIERHFSGVVCCDEHLCLLFRFRELFASQYRGIARLGKLHEFFDKDFLVGCGRDVVQYLVLVGTDNAHVLRRAVVGDFVVKCRQLRHLDEIPETLFLDDVVRYGELEIGGLLRKNGRPRVKAADVLPFEFLGTQVLEEQVQLGERVGDGRARKERRPQILARPLLYRADGKEQVERLLAALAVAQSRHAVMSGVEHQILELVALIDEDVVNAHLREVRHVVLAAVDFMLYLFELRQQVVLAFFQTFEHGNRNIPSLPVQHIEVFLHRVEFFLQDVLPYLHRLRYLAELVVAHDDAVVVVVADIIEKAYAVLRRKILFGGIEDAGLGIGCPIRRGDLRHVRLQTDNHRLVGEREAFHLMGGDAHDERFSCSNLVVGNAAPVLLEHPDAVFLTGIDGRDTVLAAERLEVEVGEALVRAVVLRPYKTVELMVVEVGEPVLEFFRLRFEPVGKTVSYLVYLGIGQLYLLGIAHLDVVAVLVLADTLHHVGYGVVQGML